MRKSALRCLRVLASVAVATLVVLEVVVASLAHDPVDHAHGAEDGRCVVCVLEHGREAPLPPFAPILSPRGDQTAAPEPASRPHTAGVLVVHPARGPPAPRST